MSERKSFPNLGFAVGDYLQFQGFLSGVNDRGVLLRHSPDAQYRLSGGHEVFLGGSFEFEFGTEGAVTFGVMVRPSCDPDQRGLGLGYFKHTMRAGEIFLEIELGLDRIAAKDIKEQALHQPNGRIRIAGEVARLATTHLAAQIVVSLFSIGENFDW